MPYVFALVEITAFTLAAAVITLTSAIFFSYFLAFAWRMWLWGSIGFVAGSFVLVASLFPFIAGVGIAGAPRTDARTLALTGLILYGPLLITTLGIALGCLYGWRRARWLGS
ncbi:MAG TPA: hypothetical protein VNX02_10090 [Steroidobacteraceae bacterium]|jgi:hypothetical protein|nr:hypothetical protein [Steroidobacteraceae bacterium]